MESLQMKVFKFLPYPIRQEIVNNPDKYPEYSSVISLLQEEFLRTFNVKLNSKSIRLVNLIIRVHNHIKENPPRRNYRTLQAWYNFSDVNYPIYRRTENMLDKWPKFMFLLFHTYIISYRHWYNLQQKPFILYIYPFSGSRTNRDFIRHMFNLYKYIDKNTTLQELRDYGY